MSYTGHDAYLEGRILSADPLELVQLLYQGASHAVRRARQCLADGDIAGRSRAISNAYDILAELMGSLDRTRGGDVADRLARLYDYMQRQLIDANVRQADAPLAETLGLLVTLAEAWQGIQPRPAAPPSANPWGAPPLVETEAAAHAWSA